MESVTCSPRLLGRETVVVVNYKNLRPLELDSEWGLPAELVTLTTEPQQLLTCYITDIMCRVLMCASVLRHLLTCYITDIMCRVLMCASVLRQKRCRLKVD